MPSYGLGSKAFQQMIPSYLSTIIPLLFFKRVLPFQKIKSNLLDALNLLIQTSVPFSSLTTPSLSSNIFLLSFKIHFREIFLTHSVLARHSYTLLPRFYIIRHICIHITHMCLSMLSIYIQSFHYDLSLVASFRSP